MTHAYGLWSLAPAAAAILLALVTRNVVLSLFSATWLAGTLIVFVLALILGRLLVARDSGAVRPTVE